MKSVLKNLKRKTCFNLIFITIIIINIVFKISRIFELNVKMVYIQKQNREYSDSVNLCNEEMAFLYSAFNVLNNGDFVNTIKANRVKFDQLETWVYCFTLCQDFEFFFI